ncbi:MAG: FAD-binding oxidoreductase [Planctomycetota bacterium]
MSPIETATRAANVCDALGIELDPAGGPSGAPLARPRDEAELTRLLQRVANETDPPRLAPLGGGTSVHWCRPEQARGDAPTLFVSTRSMVEASGGSGIVEYVPGDGTLTALGGTALDDLRAAVDEGGHRITPALRGASTIGGTLAAGLSGPDRVAFGPSRHHVLGMRVVDGAGRRARSGGRLVKNVTGFDLHRLHVGARGTLGFVVEVSLRLTPAPESEALLSSEPLATDAEAVELALALRADRRLAPRMLFVKDRVVHTLLAGRARQVDVERAVWAEHATPRDAFDGDAAEDRALALAERDPALRIQTTPSRVVSAVRALGLASTDGLVVEPDAALVDVPRALVEGDVPRWTDEVLPALDAVGARVEPRAPFGDAVGEALDGAIESRIALSGPRATIMRRLVEAFDPAHVLAIEGFPAGLSIRP